MSFKNRLYPFSEEEWDICIKVLTLLKNNPLENPSNEIFSGLISKIYKSARKQIQTKSMNEKKEHDLSIINATEINSQALNNKTLFSEGLKIQTSIYNKINNDKNCYCCNEKYKLVHFFYARLCPICAEENYSKRFQTVDLNERKVIITGGRVKIGYSTALKLLRSNAHVILTTRFPYLAFEKFNSEFDYSVWSHKLFIYGLDLRNINAIDQFIEYYKTNHKSLDILINNAAQTIQYPENYYLPIIQLEHNAMLFSKDNNNVIKNNALDSHSNIAINNSESLEFIQSNINRFQLPIDDRNKNSWNSKVTDINNNELIEVTLINQIAPYILLRELEPYFDLSNHKIKHLVNISSSEGNFSYENKNEFHSHTNMTKAALNMMTLTCSKEYIKKGILINSVDVGWVSTGATEELRKKQFDKGYIPPLDSVDGASRVIDSIITNLEQVIIYGKLIKNYKIHSW